ncbi:unnamed protein product [marine sediment metagenome]|uniref:Uncharacterized protein n=1 Tax=marine sediment metagenome TaxID=412755 RepID=X1GCR8_9ZZZZ
MKNWKHICLGGEICSACGEKAKTGENRFWESAQDQNNLFCANCAKTRGVDEE